jgi:hypothetical protein
MKENDPDDAFYIRSLKLLVSRTIMDYNPNIADIAECRFSSAEIGRSLSRMRIDSTGRDSLPERVSRFLVSHDVFRTKLRTFLCLASPYIKL